MKKIVFLTLSILFFAVSYASHPRVTVYMKGGKWNRDLHCTTYKHVETMTLADGTITHIECRGRGDAPCPKYEADVKHPWEDIENIIQENLEYYNMTTGTIKYDDMIVYYKDASLVYDEPDVPYSKYIQEVKGVEYSMTVMFEK
ncbi:MAG: hypothetical protein IKJ56_11245 [Bacteroidales bacterium]|nr:hypothetical protein [Bacteroidales bacterium]